MAGDVVSGETEEKREEKKTDGCEGCWMLGLAVRDNKREDVALEMVLFYNPRKEDELRYGRFRKDVG